MRPISNLWGGAFRYDDLKKRNQALQAQVDDMRSKIAAGQVAEQSNQQLLEQADLPFVGDLPTVRAPVLSGPVANFDDTIEIGRGPRAGCGWACRWWSAPAWWARSSRWRAARRWCGSSPTPRSRWASPCWAPTWADRPASKGVASGQGNGNQISATVDAGDPVKRGDILITRGEPGSLFPTGLPVGTVASVSSDVDNLQQTMVVDLLADVHDLSYVSVLKWLSPTS